MEDAGGGGGGVSWRSWGGGLTLEPAWPGLDPKRDEIKFDHEKLKAVADGLDGALATFENGPGTLRNVRTDCVLTPGAFGRRDEFADWHPPQALGESAANAYRGITEYYRDFIVQYINAVSLVRQTLDNYKNAEQAARGQADATGRQT